MKGLEFMKSCCVTGTREIPKDKTGYILQELRREIEQAIADGFTRFLSSMSNNVESEFVAIVVEKRDSTPNCM